MKRQIYAFITRATLISGATLLGFGTNWKIGLGVFLLSLGQAIVTENAK
jgi:hypothetical protein